MAELPFRVRFDQDIRVGQLSEISRDYGITRTAHIGNLNPAELALLALNVPLRLVDKNQSGLDRVHLPQSLVCNAREHQLSPQREVLSPFLVDDQGQSLAYRHLAATRQVFPDKRVSTYALDFLENAELVFRLLEQLARQQPQFFNRWVNADGHVLRQQYFDNEVVGYATQHGASVRVKRSQLAQRAMDYFIGVKRVIETGQPLTTSGYLLLSPEADIILQAVIDTHQQSGFGRRWFYQCCGQAMARYIANPANNKSLLIAEAYRQLRKALTNLRTIEMVLVPITNLRFACFDQEGLAMHLEIVEQEQLLNQLKQRKAHAVREAGQQRQPVIDHYQALHLQLRSEWQQRVSTLLDRQFNAFYDLQSAVRFTQHDLLESGWKVVIPQDILDLPIKALAPRLKRLLKNFPKTYHQVFKPV